MSDKQEPTAKSSLAHRFWNRINPFRFRKLGRWARIRRLTITLAGLAYLLLMAFPNVLFAHQVTHGRFQVYSATPIDPSVIRVLDDASSLLQKSTLYEPSMKHFVYLCDDPVRRRILSPTGYPAFGSTFPIFDHTILNRSEIPSNKVFSNALINNERSLSAVIAHERTHALINRHFGVIRSRMMPQWKSEGYCEYIAGATSFPIEKAKRLLKAGQEDSSHSFRYVRAYLMIKYLIDVEGKTIDEIVSNRFDEQNVLAGVRDNLDRL